MSRQRPPQYRTIRVLVATALVCAASAIGAQSPAKSPAKMPGMQQRMKGTEDMMRQSTAMSDRMDQMQQHMAAMPAGTMSADHQAMSKCLDHMSAMTAPMMGMMEQMQTMAKDMGKMLDAMELMMKRLDGAPLPPKKKV